MRSCLAEALAVHWPIPSRSTSDAVCVWVWSIYRATAFVPLSAASLDEIPVHRVKADAIQQLRKHHTRDIKADSSSSDRDRQRATLRLRDLAHRSLDWFSLHLEEFDQWLQDEQRPIGSYLTGLAGKKKVTLALRPANEMPFPTLQLSISGVKNKVSDLSQRTFTTYTIDVAFNDMTWQLSRRYKEFAALQEQLASKLPSKAASLPMLPPKHIYTPREGEFVERRRVQLEQYLHQLLVDPVISNDVLLMSFLGVVSTSRDPELSQSNKGVVHVTALHNSLHYGDIVLFSCKFGASVLQRTVSNAASWLVSGLIARMGDMTLFVRARAIAVHRVQVRPRRHCCPRRLTLAPADHGGDFRRHPSLLAQAASHGVLTRSVQLDRRAEVRWRADSCVY